MTRPTDVPAAPGVLYVTYDGVLEPLGQSQVLAYIERLAGDFPITLLSFEKPGDLAHAPRVAALASRLEARGIAWRPLRYTRRPPVLSTMYDLARGLAAVLPAALRGRFTIVHARSYVPAVLALWLRRLTRSAFLFDMRGFWVDEKADAGQWRRGGVLYRAGKWFERRFFESADAIVSLTARGVAAFPQLGYRISPHATVDVIPTCVDDARFHPGEGRSGGEGTVIGCVGTLSNWYLRDETLAYLAWLDRHIEGLRFLMVTREDRARLREDAERAGIPGDRLAIIRAEFDDMPAHIRAMSAGVFFIRPCFSKLASAATKLAEFVASGVPVVINDGIGDSGDFVRAHGAGVVLAGTTPADFEASLEPVRAMLADSGIGDRCRRASSAFRLEGGVESYRRIYRTLARAREARDGRRVVQS